MWREETEEPELVELRQHREMLSKDHKRLMREYAFVMQHDEEDREVHTDEFDGFRRE